MFVCLRLCLCLWVCESVGLRVCTRGGTLSLPPSQPLSQVGGYRDVIVSALYEDEGGLRIIGEIQESLFWGAGGGKQRR